MRAFAVIMMLQGHTVDTFLSDEFRSVNSPVFAFWLTLRGLTAPIFMFTAGSVFTYLLYNNKLSFNSNPRVIKGIKRSAILIIIAYILRYPTWKIFDFSIVTPEGWQIFFTVDALHLIACGLLLIILGAFISERAGWNSPAVFGSMAALFMLSYEFTGSISWVELLPLPLVGYFSNSTGSLFPLFPWAGYMLAGAVLGAYLSNGFRIFATKRFSYSLAGIGAVVAGFSVLIYLLGIFSADRTSFWDFGLPLIIFRLGIVLLLTSILSYISLKIKNPPPLISLIGRYTLPIYVVHLIIIYGSAWTPGLSLLLYKKLNVLYTFISAVLMVILMTSMVVAFTKFKLRRQSNRHIPDIRLENDAREQKQVA